MIIIITFILFACLRSLSTNNKSNKLKKKSGQINKNKKQSSKIKQKTKSKNNQPTKQNSVWDH